MQLAPQEIRTFFVTSVTDGRKAIQSRRMAGLLIDVMQQNRNVETPEVVLFVPPLL
jgi:hypothetical protein